VSELSSRLACLGLGPGAVVDVSSVMHGVRPVGLFHLPEADDAALEEVLRSVGLAVIHRRRLLRRSDPCSHDALLESGGGDPGSEPAASPARWSETWFARRGARVPAADELEGRTGEVLGYPPCCIAANRACASLVPYYVAYLASGVAGLWQLNRLATAMTGARLLPDYFPCGLRCRASLALSERCAGAARIEAGEAWVAGVAADLMAPLTVWDGSIVLWREWSSDGGTLELRSPGAVSVPVAAIARLPPGVIPERDGPALIAFEHLGRPRAARLKSSDGSVVEVALPVLE